MWEPKISYFLLKGIKNLMSKKGACLIHVTFLCTKLLEKMLMVYLNFDAYEVLAVWKAFIKNSL